MNTDINTLQAIPEKGDIITIGRNKITGDRSYTDDLWKVLAVSPAHIQLEPAEKRNLIIQEKLFGKRTILLVLDEHDFYDASDFILD